MRKLTIGMAVYDDYDGVYFTLQAIRMYHKEVLDDIEFIIINNNPNSPQGQAIKKFVTSYIEEPLQYLEFDAYSSTSIKNKVFDLADTPYVLCIDCHILLQPGCLKKLIEFYDTGWDDGNLLHGPLLYDDMVTVSTHFDPVWSSGMHGKWGKDSRYENADTPVFEIYAQGMGLFSCRKDCWLEFNREFRGFGGEEIYIHDKYRMHGKKVLCLPFLQWLHRFIRVNGPPYPNTWTDRYRNYIIGRLELGIAIEDVDEHFSTLIPHETRQSIKESVAAMYTPIQEVRELVIDTQGSSDCGCRS